MEEKRLIVEREVFRSPKTKKDYWRYYIKGKIRGKDIVANLIAIDAKGNELLDIVFGDETSANLKLIPYEMKDDKGYVTNSGFTYEVFNTDENGEIYTCGIKPFQKSDKAIIEKLLDIL